MRIIKTPQLQGFLPYRMDTSPPHTMQTNNQYPLPARTCSDQGTILELLALTILELLALTVSPRTPYMSPELHADQGTERISDNYQIRFRLRAVTAHQAAHRNSGHT